MSLSLAGDRKEVQGLNPAQASEENPTSHLARNMEIQELGLVCFVGWVGEESPVR